MNAKKMSRLRLLAEEATPGPWRWGRGEDSDGDWYTTTIVTVARNERWGHGDRALHETIVLYGDDGDDPEYAANRAFIVGCSPDVVIALLDALASAKLMIGAADRIAAGVEHRVKLGHWDARSEAGDALLDYNGLNDHRQVVFGALEGTAAAERLGPDAQPSPEVRE